MAESQFNVES